MKVVFASCFLDRPTKHFVESLEKSLPAVEEAGWDHAFVQEIGCPYISAARSKLVRKALDVDADVIIFIDYDLSWTPESLVKLLTSDHQVVAGAYRFKRPEERYMGIFPNDATGRPIVGRDGLIKADCAPAGFLKVTRQALTMIAKKYPELLYGDPLKYDLDLFNHGAIDGIWYGEDYAFSKRWIDAGNTLWVDPDLDITHHTSTEAYSGNLHKYLLSYNKPAPETTNPLVSIIITSHSYGKYLESAIESALAVDYENKEIIVVDNASIDDTSEIIARYPVKSIKLDAYVGVANGRNAGVKAANGEWIIQLDADDKLKPDHIKKCFKVSGADIIACGIQEFGDSHRILIPKPELSHFDFHHGNQISLGTIHRKKVWETIGGYDESMNVGYEDWDYWIRATKAGFEIGTIPDALYLYHKHGRSMLTEVQERHDEVKAYIFNKNGIGDHNEKG